MEYPPRVCYQFLKMNFTVFFNSLMCQKYQNNWTKQDTKLRGKKDFMPGDKKCKSKVILMFLT